MAASRLQRKWLISTRNNKKKALALHNSSRAGFSCIMSHRDECENCKVTWGEKHSMLPKLEIRQDLSMHSDGTSKSIQEINTSP